MTTQTLTTLDLSVLSDDEVIAEIVEMRDTIARSKDVKERFEWELSRRMRDRDATAIPHPTHDVRLETKREWMPDRLIPLREIVDPAEWDRGFTEGHNETIWVSAKADMRIIRSWRRFGVDAGRIIDAAEIPVESRLTIRGKR